MAPSGGIIMVVANSTLQVPGVVGEEEELGGRGCETASAKADNLWTLLCTPAHPLPGFSIPSAPP